MRIRSRSSPSRSRSTPPAAWAGSPSTCCCRLPSSSARSSASGCATRSRPPSARGCGWEVTPRSAMPMSAVNRRPRVTPPASMISNTCGADRLRDPAPKHNGAAEMADVLYGDEAAAEYDRAFAHVSQHFLPFLLDAARLAPGMRVLDVATGTGLAAEAALAAVGPTGSVVATDLSPAMVEKARNRLGEARNVSVSVE